MWGKLWGFNAGGQIDLYKIAGKDTDSEKTPQGKRHGGKGRGVIRFGFEILFVCLCVATGVALGLAIIILVVRFAYHLPLPL